MEQEGEQVEREESEGTKMVAGPRQVVALERKGAAAEKPWKPREERMGANLA